jgi:hypothetical protein
MGTRWHGTEPEPASMRLGGNVHGSACIGPRCMAWRFSESIDDTRRRTREYQTFYQAGYGMAHIPKDWLALVAAGRNSNARTSIPEPQRPASVPAAWLWSGPEFNDWKWAGWVNDRPDEETVHLDQLGRCGLIPEGPSTP